MNKDVAMTALMAVGSELVAATQIGDEGVIRAASSIVRFVEQHAITGAALGAGKSDVLPAMHKALGSFIVARSDMIDARLAAFALAGDLDMTDVGEMCPCIESRDSQPAPQSLRVVGSKAA